MRVLKETSVGEDTMIVGDAGEVGVGACTEDDIDETEDLATCELDTGDVAAAIASAGAYAVAGGDTVRFPFALPAYCI